MHMISYIDYFLKRAVKLTVGLGLVGAAGWTLGSEVTQPYSVEAMVSAPLIQLRAPQDGVVRNLPATGAMVAQGESLFTVAARSLAPLADGMADPAQQAELHALTQEIDYLRGMAERLQGQADSYRTARVARMELKLEEYTNRIALNEARVAVARTAAERANTLASGNLLSGNEHDAAVLALDTAERELAISRVELRLQQQELESARAATFIADGYNDTSYSTQRRDELMVRIADLTARAATLAGAAQSGATVAAFAAAAGGDGLPVFQPASLSPTPVGAPARGRVWSAPVPEGTLVAAGATVLEVVDCSRIMVVADVPRKGSVSIGQGSRIAFTATGSDRQFSGTVIRLTGSGAEAGLAVSLPREADTVWQAVALLDPAPELNGRCEIGGMGRVTLLDADAPTPAAPRVIMDKLVSLFGTSDSMASVGDLGGAALSTNAH